MIPLEILDFIVDPKRQQLIGNPAHRRRANARHVLTTSSATRWPHTFLRVPDCPASCPRTPTPSTMNLSGGGAPSMWRGRLWRFSRRSGATPGTMVNWSFQRVMGSAPVAHATSRPTRRVGAATTKTHASVSRVAGQIPGRGVPVGPVGHRGPDRSRRAASGQRMSGCARWPSEFSLTSPAENEFVRPSSPPSSTKTKASSGRAKPES